MWSNRYSARLGRAYRGKGGRPASTELTPLWRVGRFGQETSRAYRGFNGCRFRSQGTRPPASEAGDVFGFLLSIDNEFFATQRPSAASGRVPCGWGVGEGERSAPSGLGSDVVYDPGRCLGLSSIAPLGLGEVGQRFNGSMGEDTTFNVRHSTLNSHR